MMDKDVTDFHLRYRPSMLKEVVGHVDVVEALARVLDDESCHAFLFHGPAGIGKTTLARIIAEELGCDKWSVIEIDAATNTGIDAMRDVMDKAKYLPIGGIPVKVIIIDECHALSAQAWQSLQKDVEHPPSHVCWVFCTTRIDKVPATIRTRCQEFSLGLMSKANLLTVLGRVVNGEGLEVKRWLLDMIASKCDGSARRALTMLSKVHHVRKKDVAIKMLEVYEERKEVVDLCRAFMHPGLTWPKLMRLLKKIKGEDGKLQPETLRLVMCAWFTKVAMNSVNAKDAMQAVAILSELSVPCYGADGLATLICSFASLVLDSEDGLASRSP